MHDNQLIFKDYSKSYFNECLSLFDKNCPQYFATNERNDYINFLETPSKNYKVGFVAKAVTAVFGFDIDTINERARITWIMTDPSAHSKGLGTEMIHYAKKMAREHKLKIIDIAASHLSAPFFAKFGAITTREIKDGWGVNMHRIDMELPLEQ